MPAKAVVHVECEPTADPVSDFPLHVGSSAARFETYPVFSRVSR